jgi:hypothetical protein
VRRQQRDTTTPTRVYDAAREVVKRGEAKAGVALPANVRFYDASRTSTTWDGDRGIDWPIIVLVF